ncbi:MAG: NAD-dependent epimerase/dehydratase family protein [Chloroflexi bacterium]|nr:NAD-dependent epimerase/dehydratase family protein [Chloroflexota bacterium]
MKVLITGASGFLGSHIAEQFAAAGHETRLLLRRTSSREFLTFPHEEAIGDVTDPGSLRPAVEGVEAVVHPAGLIKARSEAEFRAVNEQGTSNLVKAIEERAPDLRRFVYISSMSAHGPSPGGEPRPTEAEPKPVSAYGRSKLGGETATRASALADRSVIFRMPVIYGPRDPALLPFFKAVRLRIAPLLWGGRNRLSIIYASDAASAVVAATTADTDAGGRTYCPEDGIVYAWRDLLSAIESASGRQALMVPIPLIGYQAAGLGSELFGRITGQAQVFDRDKVREMRRRAWVCSSTELREDLGWRPGVQIEEGARLTHEWYREAGWL